MNGNDAASEFGDGWVRARYSQPTRRVMFLPETGRVVPWQVRCALVDSEYLEARKVPRSPVGLGRVVI